MPLPAPPRISSLLRCLPSLRRITSVLPSECSVCRSWPAQRVCADCVARFAAPASRCTRCALRVPEGVDVCGDCLRHPPALDLCLAAVDYRYPWIDAVAGFKFQHDPGWAAPLAGVLRQARGVAAALAASDVVLPMPLSEVRLRERGFNQAALLVRHLTDKPTPLRTLLRLQASEAQSSLPRSQRLRNLRGAFAIEPSQASQLRGRRVTLVDDVMTTGATLQAAATVLREAGVQHITGIVLARTERA